MKHENAFMTYNSVVKFLAASGESRGPFRDWFEANIDTINEEMWRTFDLGPPGVVAGAILYGRDGGPTEKAEVLYVWPKDLGRERIYNKANPPFVFYRDEMGRAWYWSVPTEALCDMRYKLAGKASYEARRRRGIYFGAYAEASGVYTGGATMTRVLKKYLASLGLKNITVKSGTGTTRAYTHIYEPPEEAGEERAIFLRLFGNINRETVALHRQIAIFSDPYADYGQIPGLLIPPEHHEMMERLWRDEARAHPSGAAAAGSPAWLMEMIPVITDELQSGPQAGLGEWLALRARLYNPKLLEDVRSVLDLIPYSRLKSEIQRAIAAHP